MPISLRWQESDRFMVRLEGGEIRIEGVSAPHLAAEARVPRAVHFTHAPSTDASLDFVRTQATTAT